MALGKEACNKRARAQRSKDSKSAAKRASGSRVGKKSSPPPKDKYQPFRVSEPCEEDLDYLQEVLDEDGEPPGEIHYNMLLELLEKIQQKRQARGNRWARCSCRKRCPEAAKRCRCTGIKIFTAQADQHGLSPGSVAAYLNHVDAWRIVCDEKWDAIEIRLLHRLRNLYKKRYGEQKNDSGSALGKEDCDRVLKALVESKDGRKRRAAFALYFMGCTGPRLCDLRKCKNSDFLPKERYVRMKIRGGKTVRSAGEAVPLNAYPHKCLIAMPPGMEQFLATRAASDPEARPFEDLDTGLVGSWLRQFRDELNLDVTTRSFRKHFAARIYAESGGDRLAVSRALAHSNTKMAGAFYTGLDNHPVVEEYMEAFGYELKTH